MINKQGQVMKDNSTLAKLLAEEDLHVVHKQVSTASFDVKRRELVLPIWKDMSKPVQDMLTLHEVGHALYTPLSMLEESKERKIEHSFVNVVEDARIEKMIQEKYLGAKSSFKRGYSELIGKDFFKVNGKDISNLGLIDRINLHFKNVPDVPFADSELVWVDKVANTKTPADVLNVAEELYKFQSENEESQSEEQQNVGKSPEMITDDDGEQEMESQGSGESEDDQSGAGMDAEKSDRQDGDVTEEKVVCGESDEKTEEKTETQVTGKEGSGPTSVPITATTDNTYGNSLDTLRDKSAYDRDYVRIPKVNIKEIIITPKQILADKSKYDSSDYTEYREYVDSEFIKLQSESKKTVSYLVKEFEMKKSADQYARASVSKTGSLDMGRLHTYKFNEDLFAKVTTLPGATNHGMVMYLDWSGSMAENILGTVKQLFNLIWFCNRVKIPFEVYAFTNSWNYSHDDGRNVQSKNVGDLNIRDLRLLNFVSSKMSASEQCKMMTKMLSIAVAYDSRAYRMNHPNNSFRVEYPSERMGLGGTPLNEAIISAMDIVPQFKRDTGVQKVNTIFLTDGYGSDITGKVGIDRDGNKGIDNISRLFRYNKTIMVVTDPVTRKTHIPKVNDNGFLHRDYQTRLFLGMLKDRMIGMNIVGFFIAGRGSKGTVDTNVLRDKMEMRQYDSSKIKEYRKILNKDNVLVSKSQGYDEFYILPGAQKFELSSELEVEVGANKAALKRAFGKMSNGKIVNRPLLNKFVKMVA
tara:strand:- start:9 stop:2264 length:2256 start_codon:yes stop_codon:yes gene_type:complete